jgi:hypothetical protein
MGCSIQPNPKEKKQAVEADIGNGLIGRHAYSLLDLNEITRSNGDKVRLVKIRNPHGRTEWEGAYGDSSKERDESEEGNPEEAKEINQLIYAAFNRKELNEEIVVDAQDGTFFMSFDYWLANFTSLFLAMKFPLSWTGKRTQGQWTTDNGGNRDMGTWISNPKIKFKFNKIDNGDQFRNVFVGLYIKDSRLTLGADYIKVSYLYVMSDFIILFI